MDRDVVGVDGRSDVVIFIVVQVGVQLGEEVVVVAA